MAAALLSAPAQAADGAEGQLDGWAGNWTIADSSGRQIGRSTIEEQVSQLMLFELRLIEGNQAPQALWFEFSERNKGWTQLFRGPFGIREFGPMSPAGEWPMILGAEDVPLADGTNVSFRMTVSRLSPDSYRRVLERTRDEGATWETVFDYHYAREH